MGTKHIVECKDYNGFKNTKFLMKADDFRLTEFKSDYTILHKDVRVQKGTAITKSGKYFKVFADWSVKEDKNVITLESKVVGVLDGKECKGPYRLILFNKDGKWGIKPEQAFRNEETKEYEFNEFSGLPAWNWDSMKTYPHDMIWIDMGQKWGLKGMQAAIKEGIEKTEG